MTQLTKSLAAIEANPFTLAPPPSIDDISPRLFDFLREQANNLRQTHELNQAGDSTFNWEILTEVQSRALFTVGSIGRFVHPYYGLILARYVEFDSMQAGLPLGGPLGWLSTENEFKWKATNQLEKSEKTLIAGVGASYEMPTDGQFGWIIVCGINIQTLALKEAPTPLGAVAWHSSGYAEMLGELSGPGFGRIFNRKFVSDSGIWTFTPGSIFIDSLSLGDSSALDIDVPALQAQIQAFVDEMRLKDESLQSQITTLSGQVEGGLNSTSRIIGMFGARISAMQGQIVDYSQEVGTQLQLAVSYRNQAETAAANATQNAIDSYGSLQATNILNQQIQAYVAEAGAFAESSTVMANEATIQSNIATTQASVATTQAASATASAASALVSQKLSAAYSATRGMVINGFFDVGPEGWLVTNGSWISNVLGTFFRGTISLDLYVRLDGFIEVDTSRKYKLHARWQNHTVAQVSYIGFECYAADDTRLGNAYIISVSGAALPAGMHEYDQVYTGEVGTPPLYTTTDKFITGTKKVKPMFQGNYFQAVGGEVDLHELWFEDVTDSEASALSASAANTSAVNASASAASASSSAILAATVGNQSLLTNPVFANWPGATALPPSWFDWTGNGGTSKVTGQISPNAIRLTGHASLSRGFYVSYGASASPLLASVKPGENYVIDLVFTVLSGSPTHPNLLLSVLCYDAADAYLGAQFQQTFSNIPDIARVKHATSTTRMYRYSIPIKLTVANTAKIIVAITLPTGMAVSTSDFHMVNVRPQDTRVTTLAEAQVDSAGNAIAAWSTTTNVGSASAAIALRTETAAGTYSSSLALEAEEIQIYNNAAGVRKQALRIAGGNAVFAGDLDVGGSIRVGSNRIRVALQSFQVSAADGASVSFGTGLGQIPQLIFNTENLAPLSSGQQYLVQALSLTDTGFTMKARIQVPGAITTVNNPDTGVTGTPDRQTHKTDSADAYNGNYAFTVSANIRCNSFEGSFYEGDLIVELFVRPSGGAWTSCGQFFMYTTSGTIATVNHSETFIASPGIAIGLDGSNTEFGVSAVNPVGPEGITNLSVSYQKSTPGSDATASPSGQQVIVTVIPQNV